VADWLWRGLPTALAGPKSVVGAANTRYGGGDR